MEYGDYEKETSLPHFEKLKLRKKARKLGIEPQFKFDDLYITIFNEKRVYMPDGRTYYVPLKKNLTPTGIEVFDEFLQLLADGDQNTAYFCKIRGMRQSDLNALCFVLTGLEARVFRTRWLTYRIYELLRFTDMEIRKVAKVSGAGSGVNLCFACKRDFDDPPYLVRYIHSIGNDVGRYRL